MPINDPVNNIYMNNMYVTGDNIKTNAANSVNTGVNTGGQASSQNLSNSFSQMLGSMMGMSAVNTIGNFSDSTASSGTSYMDGMMGLGGSSDMSSLLGGMGGSSDSMVMMLLLLLLASQNNNGQNNNLLGNLGGNNIYGQQNTVAQTCNHTSAQGVPSNSWLAASPSLTNVPGQRNAVMYRAVIDQFNVEGNERYRVNKQGIGDTYCNIFTWDVTRAMGAEIPHFINSTTGAPVSSGGSNTTELNANQVNDWLNTHGASYGWTKVSAEEAQYYANMGMPAATSWKNPAGHGHLQVISPSVEGTYNPEKGVAIAQAGRQLKNYDYITSVYGSNTLGQIEYFVHI